jgi:hypothetical protein
MADSDSSRQGSTNYAPDELIVAASPARLVREDLERLGARVTGAPEEAPELGLTRLRLNLDRLDLGQLRAGGGAAAPAGSGPIPHLDRLISQLRFTFAERYGGWYPTMGKNRDIGHVTATYVLQPGGDGRPRATMDSLAPRAAEPGNLATVAVLDTRLATHPWLAGGYLANVDALLDPDALGGPGNAGAPDGAPAPLGHATFVAGLVLQHAPGATLTVRPVLSDAGSADSWSVARAIVAAASLRPDVLNLSFGCRTDDGQPPLVLSTALDKVSPETVVVAAAGNHGDQQPPRPIWPAAFQGVLAVGAVDADGQRPQWSPDAPWVDVAADGVDVVSTYLTGMARWSGTSFAAASVSGRLAAATTEPGLAPAALARLVGAARRSDGGRPILEGVRDEW